MEGVNVKRQVVQSWQEGSEHLDEKKRVHFNIPTATLSEKVCENSFVFFPLHTHTQLYSTSLVCQCICTLHTHMHTHRTSVSLK